MTIYNVNSQILKLCPRFLLNQRWKSLSLYVRQLHSSMSPFEIVQAIQSAGVGVGGLDLRRTVVVLRSVDEQEVGETAVIRFRCVSKRIEKFGGSHEGNVKRHRRRWISTFAYM